MPLKLASALGMPVRDRNALLAAAGYQPVFRETPIEAPQMAEVRKVLALILRQHEPFAACAFDRDFGLPAVIASAWGRMGEAFSPAHARFDGPRAEEQAPRGLLQQLPHRIQLILGQFEARDDLPGRAHPAQRSSSHRPNVPEGREHSSELFPVNASTIPAHLASTTGRKSGFAQETGFGAA